MSAVTSDNFLRVRGRWLALALWLLACAEDPVQPPADDDDDVQAEGHRQRQVFLDPELLLLRFDDCGFEHGRFSP